MYTLDAVHPITHAVGNTIKRVILILFSVVRFGTPMTQQRSATLPPRAPLAYAYPRFRLSMLPPHAPPYNRRSQSYEPPSDACRSITGSTIAIAGVFMYSIAKTVFKSKPKVE